MKSRSRMFTFGLTALAVTGLLAGCVGGAPGDNGGSDGSKSPRAEKNELVLIASDDPGTLDYVTSNLTSLALWIPGNVVETLLSRDEAGELAPGLAESWNTNEDATVYNFHLREASFSDGSPVTADDVVYSLNTMRESNVGLNKAPYAAVTDITAVDGRTVEVTLNRPSFAFIDGMTTAGAMIGPKAAVGSLATNPIGSGPYVVDEYKTGNRLVFTKNDSYWGDPAFIDRVEVRFINEATSALNALKTNEADGYPFMGQDLWERIGSEGLDKKMTLETYSEGGDLFHLVFNTNEPPTNDPAFRSAVAKAIDRQAVVDLFNAPWGLVATCDYVTADKASLDPCRDPFSPKDSMAALEAAGYAGATVELTTLTDIGNLVAPADLVAQELLDVGLDVERKQYDLARFSQVVFSAEPPKFGVTVMTTEYTLAQSASCPDPANAGWTTYCDPIITQILADADSAQTPAEREALMTKAQARMQEYAAYVPLAKAKGVGLLHHGIQGWRHPMVVLAIDLAHMHW